MTHYPYYLVESIESIDTTSNKTIFKFNLNFYALEYDAKKKQIEFTCDEDVSNASEVIKSETKEFSIIHVY